MGSRSFAALDQLKLFTRVLHPSRRHFGRYVHHAVGTPVGTGEPCSIAEIDLARSSLRLVRKQEHQPACQRERRDVCINDMGKAFPDSGKWPGVVHGSSCAPLVQW